MLRKIWLPCLIVVACLTAGFAAEVGPEKGALVIVGGGGLPREVVQRFIDLAGGTNAHFVIIPTAEPGEEFIAGKSGDGFLRAWGVTNISILHTRDRAVADSEAFIEPLKKANAIWFGGGRQWRFVDAYLGTKTEKAFHEVLQRGGVIGGSSAGATIQASYLVRGAREGNHIMMAKGYEQGFAFLKNSAIDQHLLARKREKDLVQVIQARPELLGIGIDEATAVVVKGDECEILGKSKAAFYDVRIKGENDQPYIFLSPGEKFDLKSRQKIESKTAVLK